MAASTSADSNNNCRYNVFINYRGIDVKTFAVDLYCRLMYCGLRVLDSHKLLPGDYFVPQIDRTTRTASVIDRTIRTASVHVAILSPSYADSHRCLQDLVLMLESGIPIIPVFYGVKPTDLRCIAEGKGCSVQSLLQHENKGRCAPDTIRKWRNALSQVADISGFELDAFNDDPRALADEVVQELLRRAKTEEWSTAAKYVVGLHEKVEEFENKVLCAKPQVVGIVGVGGVGKTTLAKELFDQKRVNYSKYCFLPNVREEARLGFLNSLQKKLLKSLTGTDAQMNSIDEGKEALKKHLSSCRVLMVLDDVDHLNQIDALLPVRTHLLSDSLVVITSRDEGVITSSGVENASIYHLTGPNHQYSKQLFCAFAFNRPYPRVGFEHLVDNFLEVCEGLPLFLRIFGALLNDNYHGGALSFGKEILYKLQRVPPGKTQEKLQICYQILNWEEQQIFLDSACFFIGQKRETVTRIWEGSGWNGHLGFGNLQFKCLLAVDEENNIQMHDHLRDFGRAVADTSSPRRLLHSKLIKDILEQLSVSSQS